jgi:hypothetical protein
MSPYEYYRKIRIDEVMSRHDSQIDFLINNTFRALFISLIRPIIKFVRRGIKGFKYMSLHSRIQPQKPRGKYNSDSKVVVEIGQYRACIKREGSFIDAISHKVTIGSNNHKVIFFHAYYIEEAMIILDMLNDFWDYDIVITSPFDSIIGHGRLNAIGDRLYTIKVPNHGRDVFPFLASINIIDISKYDYFIKIHTKRSQHLDDKGEWFKRSMMYLIGSNRVSDRIFDLMEPFSSVPVLLGEKVLPIQDHLANNIYWMEELIPEDLNSISNVFIPGTMFIGNANFLDHLREHRLEEYIFEQENMQLDGCAMHAIERYFGYVSQKYKGLCMPLEEFSFRYYYD